MKIMAIFAHPDDECYGPGGYLAKQIAAGHHVHLITLTRGERGSLGKCRDMTPTEIALMRSEELKKSVAALGIQQHSQLDFPDKGLSTYPASEATERIHKLITQQQPAQVITFHPNGISGHPDHCTLSAWLMKLHQQLQPDWELLLYGLSTSQTKYATHRKLFAIPDAEIDIRADVSKFLPKKIAAIQCHTSQLNIFNQLNSLAVSYFEFAKTEHFSRCGYPAAETN